MDQKIIDQLDAQSLKYELYEHPQFNTCAVSSAWHKESGRPGQRVKNLFLRNKNGKQHLLLLLPHELDFDKALFKQISGEKCGMASDDRLWEHLQVKPGSVSPLALVHDKDQHVKVFIESSLMKAEALHLHPGDSNWSVQITPDDVVSYLQALGYEPQVIEWQPPKTDD